MMLHLQTTLTDVESAVQSLVQNLQDSNSANQRVAYESEDYPGKVAELHVNHTLVFMACCTCNSVVRYSPRCKQCGLNTKDVANETPN